MRRSPFHLLADVAFFLVPCLISLGSFGYALRKWLTGTEARKLPTWRQVATVIAFLAVATQVAVFAAYWIWPQIGRNYQMSGQWARWVDPPFLVALPCAIAGKGAVRWLLLTASVILFVICFFITLGD